MDAHVFATENEMTADRQGATRVVVVTGAARGIGSAACRALAKDGLKVMIHYRTRPDEACELLAAIQDDGGTADIHPGDLTNEEDVKVLVHHTQSLWGGMDVLCNNAGVNRHQELTRISRKDWIDVVHANTLTGFPMTQAVVPLMLVQRWGRIINISSVAAYLAVQPCRSAHYAAAKGAVSAFGRCLAAS